MLGGDVVGAAAEAQEAGLGDQGGGEPGELAVALEAGARGPCGSSRRPAGRRSPRRSAACRRPWPSRKAKRLGALERSRSAKPWRVGTRGRELERRGRAVDRGHLPRPAGGGGRARSRRSSCRGRAPPARRTARRRSARFGALVVEPAGLLPADRVGHEVEPVLDAARSAGGRLALERPACRAAGPRAGARGESLRATITRGRHDRVQGGRDHRLAARPCRRC